MTEIIATNRAELIAALEQVKETHGKDFSVMLADSHDTKPRTVYRFPWPSLSLKVEIHKQSVRKYNEANEGKKRVKRKLYSTEAEIKAGMIATRAARLARTIRLIKRQAQRVFKK